MANSYFYEAVDPSGQVVLGKMEGASENEVHRNLRQMGYRPQSVAPVSTAGTLTVAEEPVLIGTGITPAANRSVVPSMTGINAPVRASSTQNQTLGSANQGRLNQARNSNIVMTGSASRTISRQSASRTGVAYSPAAATQSFSRGGVSTRDLMMFFRQFASLVHSGITVFGALDNLAPRTKNVNLSKTATEMANAARSGGRISEVMQRYPLIFPDHITATVAAGELGGFLEIALDEITQNYERNIALYKGAWIPKVMATQALFMIPFAQPLFTTLFSSMDMAANIKLYLELVFLRNLPITIVIYLLIRWGSKHIQLPKYRRWRDETALKIPPFGDLQRQEAIAAFLRMMRRLYHAGVSPIQAWEGAMNTSSNVAIREKLIDSYALIQRGGSLPDAFAATGLFTDQVEQLIFTGHQSGQMVEMLDQASDFYKDRVEESTSKSRFMMLRLGILAMLILGGGVMIWLMKSYFDGIFHFVDTFFGPDGS